ncbi:hypothetical protein TVAGG3_0063680 [Trichomonas vaginalis G3]|uniref:hypothetical protein n=1 Tax=Trichomonas vaginalis (strain ATCC PRA-98 / G3) TaxID=412133 RepID=UPI0021E5A7A2|nr:hypothetical protein TVAGG3_0063680 [Trichomonas vaginalis G3]KAI5542196.1 hypothetical protein TVAGG3_0063680 [Trichomonas vaginalis G3]
MHSKIFAITVRSVKKPSSSPLSKPSSPRTMQRSGCSKLLIRSRSTSKRSKIIT